MTTATMHIGDRGEMIVKKILSAVLFMTIGFLLARIQLLMMICPFGPAFIAACVLAKRQEALLATAGVCLGSLLVPDNTLYIVSITLMLSVTFLFIGYRNAKRWMVLMSTACAYAVGAAIFKTQDVYTFMMAVLECLIALIMIYVLHTVLQIMTTNRRRNVFSTEETICLALAAFIIVCMFGPLNIQGVYIANILALFLVLCVAYTGGAALGAGVGLALGMALCLGISAEVTVIGMLGISGMIGGTLRKLKKGGVALGYMLSNLLFIIAFYNTSIWVLVLVEITVATLLFVILPKKIFLFAGRYFDAQTKREYEYGLHSKRFKELTVGRLKEVSEVFLQTGEMFAKEAEHEVQKGANISGVLSIVAESACKDCVFRKSCWDKDFINTYNVFNKLFTIYEKNGSLEIGDIAASFAKKCYNIEGILSTAENVFGAYLLNVKWKRKIEESRLITGKQLKGVAKVVSDLGLEMDTGFQFLESVEERITVSLDAVGICAKEVCAESNAGGIAVGLRVKNYGTEHDYKYSMERVVSNACGVKMKRVNQTIRSIDKFCTLRYEQARKFGVLTGIAMVAKHGVSGDSHSFQGLKDGRYMLMLCDGMGSGERANRESTAAVSLIENFYQAGFNEKIIFDTINRLLILKGNEEVFSTVDLCMLDLKSGSAKFTKIGAECSYMLTNDGITTITPGSLPIGILDEVTPVSTHKNLVGGDMIIMMSDGIADTIKQDADKWFADIPKGTAQETADAILAKALGDNAPPDDMTVMVSRIIEA